MKITLIGHLCVDVIHLPKEPAVKDLTPSFGGISWSVGALANLLTPSDTIYPVFGVGDSEYTLLTEHFQRYGNVDTSGIFRMNEPTNQVQLFYSEDGQHRIECSKYISPPIDFARIKNFLNVDGILVNMVSGFDVTLETLDMIRMHARDKSVPIHFDFHSLTLGIDREFKRFRRPVTDWRRWCFMMNSIQMSEEEAAGLTSEMLKEEDLVRQIMTLMVHALIVTRDARGGTLVLQENKKLRNHHFEGILTKAIDPTGCGDVFGAAFFSEYLKTRDYVHAVEFANNVAAMKTTFLGTQGLNKIQDALTVKSAS